MYKEMLDTRLLTLTLDLTCNILSSVSPRASVSVFQLLWLFFLPVFTD